MSDGGGDSVGSRGKPGGGLRADLTRRELFRLGGSAAGGVALGALAGYTAAGGGRGAQEPWKVGAVIPKGDAYRAEGEQTLRGLGLGLRVVNRRGGVRGRPVELLKYEVADLSEETLTAAAEALVGQGIVAALLGFTSSTCAEFDVYAAYRAPVFHLSRSESSLDAATRIGANIFRCMPRVDYGKPFVGFMDELVASGAFVSASRTVAIVAGKDTDGSTAAADVKRSLEGSDWSLVLDRQVDAPATTDWRPLLAEARTAAPSVVFVGISTAREAAALQTAFASDPFPALIYVTFAPSVPEFLTLAGTAAGGVIWSTPLGTILGDSASASFEALYAQRSGTVPLGLSQLGANFDLALLWAQCAALAKRPTRFSSVEKIVPSVLYRGVSGTFNLAAENRVAAGYPAEVADPGLGLPHLTFQIQGGEHVRLAPDPYRAGRFKRPTWW